jgi:pimeloyl-ACP methyl ester carboxylesterase
MATESKQDLPGFEEREIRVDGGSRIRYFVGGSGPPLVLVHGLGGMATNWRLVAPALAGERRIVIPDLPGHGASEPLAEARTLDPFADAALAVAAAEGVTAAPWVGHSMGGAVVLHAAVREPDAVTGLVLANAAGISTATRLAEVALTVLGRVHPGKIVGKRAELVSRSARGRTWAFSWGVADPVGLDPAMARAFLEGATFHSDTLTAGLALVASDPRQDLDRVSCPCLVLWGADDTWVPLADGMEYARRLRAPLRIIADCAHLSIGERPDAVVRAIREFVAGLS